MSSKIIIAASLLFLCSSIQANKNLTLTCPITKQYMCSLEACTIIKPSVTITLRLTDNNAEYSRCDKKGCDKYLSSIIHSGTYTLISTTGKNSNIKLNFNSMTFMETSSLDHSAFIAFGHCQYDVPFNKQ